MSLQTVGSILQHSSLFRHFFRTTIINLRDQHDPGCSTYFAFVPDDALDTVEFPDGNSLQLEDGYDG